MWGLNAHLSSTAFLKTRPPQFPFKVSSDSLAPHLNRPLLEALDKLWPDTCPSPKDPDMVIKCAQRQVITTLWQILIAAEERGPLSQ